MGVLLTHSFFHWVSLNFQNFYIFFSGLAFCFNGLGVLCIILPKFSLASLDPHLDDFKSFFLSLDGDHVSCN